MGRSLGRRLAAEGLRVVLHDDEFDQGTPDQEWLPVVGARGWVVLTKDGRLRFRPLEKEALIAANVRVFVFTGGNVPRDSDGGRDRKGDPESTGPPRNEAARL